MGRPGSGGRGAGGTARLTCTQSENRERGGGNLVS